MERGEKLARTAQYNLSRALKNGKIKDTALVVAMLVMGGGRRAAVMVDVEIGDGVAIDNVLNFVNEHGPKLRGKHKLICEVIKTDGTNLEFTAKHLYILDGKHPKTQLVRQSKQAMMEEGAP